MHSKRGFLDEGALIIRSCFFQVLAEYVTIKELSCSNLAGVILRKYGEIRPSAQSLTKEEITVSERPEIISLLGIPHYAVPAEGEALAKLEQDLVEAEAALAAAPDDAGCLMMHGRRLAYLWRYHEAIAVYTGALTRYSEEAALYRHRGHRYISVRRFGPAVRDLARANELKPDDFDILYHLGLARWLQGNYAGARQAYEAYLPLCENEDQQIPLTYWLYMTLRRLGCDTEAADLLAGAGDPDVKDDSVFYLNNLRLFRGDRTEGEIRELMKESDLAAGTLGYGLGCWYLLAGRDKAAEKCFKEVLEGKYWPAFGFIAAEVETARLAGLQ